MEANSTDKKTFLLTENGNQLGELIYKNLFSVNAEIKLPDSESYTLAHKDFFGTSIEVTKDENRIANLAMTWKGQIIIAFSDGREYILKLIGLFQNKYIIENAGGEKIIQLEPQFNWRQFHYNYTISYSIANDSHAKDPLLLMLALYATNYFIATISGSNAGMMF